MSKNKGKGREDDGLSDMDLALQLQQGELEQATSLLNDRRMAQSILLDAPLKIIPPTISAVLARSFTYSSTPVKEISRSDDPQHG